MMIEGRKIDNFTMRIYLETIQSIVEPNGLRSILNYGHLKQYIDDFPPDNDNVEVPREDLHKLYVSLLELFGNRGVRSLQLRVGREVFRTGVEKRPGIVRALQVAARLLPETRRMRLALEKFVEGVEERFSEVGEPTVELQEEEDSFYIIDRDCYMSEGIQSGEPVCSVYIGITQSLIEWITGHNHEIKEIECRAMGYPADVFQIAKAKEDQKA